MRWKNLYIFNKKIIFFTDFDGYYIVRTDKGQPRPKYIFNKCETNIYFFTLQRFGPSPSPNFKYTLMVTYFLLSTSYTFLLFEFLFKIVTYNLPIYWNTHNYCLNVSSKDFIKLQSKGLLRDPPCKNSNAWFTTVPFVWSSMN